MRKLAYGVIIVLAIALGWSVAALIFPGIKSASVGFWSVVLGGGWILITGAWNSLMTIASANGTAFLVYTLGILVFGLVFWALAGKLWAKRPAILKRASQTIPKSLTLQREPSEPEPSPVLTLPAKVVEEPSEVTE